MALSAILGALMSAHQLGAAPVDRRVPVGVHVNCDVGVCSRLQDALERGLRRHPRQRLDTSDSREDVTIEVDSGVQYDRLGGRNIIIYIAYVYRGSDRGDPHPGVCYFPEVSKCVRDILRLADLEAERR